MFKLKVKNTNKNAVWHYWGVDKKFNTAEEAEEYARTWDGTNMPIWQVVRANGRPVDGHQVTYRNGGVKA